MKQEQLALFGDDEVIGTGRLTPWPTAEPEPETVGDDPDQLAFDDTGSEEAA